MAYPHIQLNNIPAVGVEETEVKALSLNLFALFINIDGTTYQVFNEEKRPLYTDCLKDMREIILSVDHIPENEVYLEQATGLYYQLHSSQQAHKTRLPLTHG